MALPMPVLPMPVLLMPVLHVTTPAGWEETKRVGLHDDPFLHLCTDAQLPFVLARHFAGRNGLLLVRLDPTGLDVRWESSEPGMDPFPHLYGWAPASAAIEITPIP